MVRLRRSLYSVIGVSLIVAALAGLAISVVGIIGIWRFQQAMQKGVLSTLDVLETTLGATNDGLEVAGRSLDQAAESLDSLAGVIQTTGKTVRDSIPLANTFARVTAVDIPASIKRTQTALESAQSSARFIDTTLQLLTSIPFLSMERYNPKVPLNEALGEASSSLDPISRTLSEMDQPLGDAVTNLNSVAEQLDAMATSIAEIKSSLADAKEVTAKYLQIVSTLNGQLTLTRNNLPVQLEAIAWFITVALIWLGLTQVGLLIQGLEMIGLFSIRPSRPRR